MSRNAQRTAEAAHGITFTSELQPPITIVLNWTAGLKQ
jgi:hypothetical protein